MGKVDKEKMDLVEQTVDQHLRDGGWLCFFPEGQMNKEPDTIMPFRFGGLKKALAFDARIASMVTYGNTRCWPRKSKVGGFPGRINHSMKAVAPKGCKALVADLRSKASDEENKKEDHEILATYC